MRWSAIVASACILAACGASSPRARAPNGVVVTLDPADFLRRVGGEASVVLREPEHSIEELDETRTSARGMERRRAMRDLAVALVFASLETEGREARRLRQRAERMLDAAGRRNRDDELAAELDFVRLWMAWRTGSRAASRRAERFTRRHEQAGTLTTIGWMVRGEVAMGEEAFDEALAAYRFALGQLGTPLYAYALYRTAHVHRARGEAEEASQALEEVERMGCEPGVDLRLLQVASAAASERGSGLRLDPDDVMRPAVCPSPEEQEDAEEEGWRPAE